jgi:hypothetical protein
VGDAVAGRDQAVERGEPRGALREPGADPTRERDADPFEVGVEGARPGVGPVQHAGPGQHSPDHVVQDRVDLAQHDLGGRVVQVAGVALELRGEQEDE